MTVHDDSHETTGPSNSGSEGVRATAQAQAQQVGGTTKDEAANVVQSAKEQAQAVTADVREQTKQLTDEARGQLIEQAGTQRDRAVESLRSVSDELSAMAERSETSGLGVQLAREGGELTHKVADFLEEREPGQILDEVRDLARRRPGAFLLGAAVAGLLVGRATRGAKSAHSSDGDASTTDGTVSTSRTSVSGSGSPYGQDVTDGPATTSTDLWGPDSSEYVSGPGEVPQVGGIR